MLVQKTDFDETEHRVRQAIPPNTLGCKHASLVHTTHVSLVGHVKLLGVTAPAVERPFLGGDLETLRIPHECAVERLEGHDGAADLILSHDEHRCSQGGRPRVPTRRPV